MLFFFFHIVSFTSFIFTIESSFVEITIHHNRALRIGKIYLFKHRENLKRSNSLLWFLPYLSFCCTGILQIQLWSLLSVLKHKRLMLRQQKPKTLFMMFKLSLTSLFVQLFWNKFLNFADHSMVFKEIAWFILPGNVHCILWTKIFQQRFCIISFTIYVTHLMVDVWFLTRSKFRRGDMILT